MQVLGKRNSVQNWEKKFLALGKVIIYNTLTMFLISHG